MRITFVLPAPVTVPMGGAAVVYRHAGALAERGHEVTVVSPRRTLAGWRGRAMRAAVRVRDALHGVGGEYYSAPGVRSVVVPEIDAGSVPPGDVVVATGVQTARPVAALPAWAGAPVYFIQGDETFADPSARQTWRLPLARITCAEWLAHAVRQSGEAVVGVVPNAVDPADFGLDVPIENRPARVVALYHRHPVKGPDVLIDALDTVREGRADVSATVFAARRPSHRLPRWVDVRVRPSVPALRALYNGAAVLLHPSRSEGWPLVPMEAAACGCAVIATQNPGVQEYLTAGESMQPAPLGDGRALGHAALAVLSDDALRQRLAQAGRAAVARFSWADSADALESALRTIAGRP